MDLRDASSERHVSAVLKAAIEDESHARCMHQCEPVQMSTAEEHEARIQTRDWAGLRDLWEQIEDRNTPGFDAGKAFEYLVLRLFQLDGAEVRWPYRVIIRGVEIEQIDGIIYVAGMPFLIESKDESQNIAIDPIAKLRGQMARRHPGTIGMLFSYRGFTGPALMLVQQTSPQNVLLWSGFEVLHALRRERIVDALVAKYRHCIEHGIPDFDTRLINWHSGGTT
jgi:Restriction endonuclease